MTLALLLTAVTGAWAEALEGRTFVDFKIEFRTNPYSVITPATGYLPDGVSVTGTSYNGTQHGVQGGTITVPVDGPVKFTIGACYYSKADIVVKKDGELFTTVNNNATCGETTGNYSQYVTYKYNGEAATLTFESADNVYIPYFFAEAVEPGIEVTTNATEEGAAFTVASFDMPNYDLDVDYELVRDMSVQMTAQVGDGTQEQPRYRVKKDGNNKFIPADMEITAVPALFTVNDAIEQKALTQTQDYIVQIYAIDAEGQPTGDPMTFATFTFEPGIYAVKAVAAQGSDYDGETALSNTFKLFQGYEVTVPAGEYITYYKDEALYVENENAQLYTISSVTESEAVLSDAITVAPANTPLLVYNKSQTETLTFLLIPTTDKTPDNVTAATQFVGTLEATTIPASTTGDDNYALNGYAFVWVKTAIEVGANKCWLHIASQPAGARGNTRSITGGNGTTGIDAIENVTIDNEGWYDLQGRKLQAKPNRGGIYIHNGKKVVVRK